MTGETWCTVSSCFQAFLCDPFCTWFDSRSEALFFHLNNPVLSHRLAQKRWLIFSTTRWVIFTQL